MTLMASYPSKQPVWCIGSRVHKSMHTIVGSHNSGIKFSRLGRGWGMVCAFFMMGKQANTTQLHFLIFTQDSEVCGKLVNWKDSGL